MLFGCRHPRITFPITPPRGKADKGRATYVVCLDCGTEMDYDWTAMKVKP